MPLLPKGPEIYPDPDLFTLPAGAFPWRVAHVRSRQEKVLARLLFEHRVPFYLPQVEKRSHRRGRSVASWLPLFPGYLFFRGNTAQEAVVVRAPVTAAVLEVNDQTTLDAELRQIRELQLSGASLRVMPTFVTGDPVSIREGAFRGYQGIVWRERGRSRLIVHISLLQKSIAVEFERGILSPVR